jgi:anti-sigma regulatory factor (Ser/Thr protein kinase)
MHGTTSPAQQANAGGHTCHAGLAPRASSPLAHDDSRARPAGAAMRIPPFAGHQEGSSADQWPLCNVLELAALPSAVPCARLHTRHLLWELCNVLELAALPSAVPCARLHARHLVREWGVLVGRADSTELLVSEMITNAVQVSREMSQAAVRLWLVSDRAQVLILAWDASPLPPVQTDPDESAENGRGLLLVDAISDQWGWYFPRGHMSASAPDQRGKVVWAVVR